SPLNAAFRAGVTSPVTGSRFSWKEMPFWVSATSPPTRMSTRIGIVGEPLSFTRETCFHLSTMLLCVTQRGGGTVPATSSGGQWPPRGQNQRLPLSQNAPDVGLHSKTRPAPSTNALPIRVVSESKVTRKFSKTGVLIST